MKRLIITEKQSAARAISEALGLPEPDADWTENDVFAVSWCRGHLFEPAPPADYDPSWAAWDLAALPILPDTFSYRLRRGCETRFRVLTLLMDRTDIDGVINACDAGREGELIFRLVYDSSGCTKPVERLWISSLEAPAILAGLENLRPASDYDALHRAALARQQADWLVGINATRLLTQMAGSLQRVGRVSAPTLRLLTDRAEERERFVPHTELRVRLSLGGFEASSGCLGREAAEELKNRCQGAAAVCTGVETKRETENPPRLFDLTALQREASRRLGLTAAQTLAAAQSLYEKQLLSYPRTDSRFLTDDMGGAALRAAAASGLIPADLPGLELHPGAVLDSSRVGDHPALVPAAQPRGGRQLTEDENVVYEMCARRLICAMLPACEQERIRVLFCCGGAEFELQGRRLVDPGWKVLAADPPAQTGAVPPFVPGQEIRGVRAQVAEKTGEPPALYTDGTLLAAMERAGAGGNGCGLGTPATRAQILEKLIGDGLAVRDGRSIRATRAGRELIGRLPEMLKSPALTGQWEARLAEISQGSGEADLFLRDVRSFVQTFVKKALPQARRLHPVRDPLGRCPRCSGLVGKVDGAYRCRNWKSCGFVLRPDEPYFAAKGVKLTEAMVRRLLAGGVCRCRRLRGRSGKKYTADIVLADSGTGPVGFALRFPKGGRL